MPLGRRSAERTESLAATAGEHVQAVIAAAEAAAAKIREEAEAEAERIRQSARDEVAAAREEAAAAREHAAAQARGELERLLDSLASIRRRAEELEADLAAIRGPAGTGDDEVAARAAEPAIGAVPAEPATGPGAAEPATGAGSPPAEEAPTGAPAPETEGPGDADVEGARLIALNMALNGSSREEVDRHLAENFSLSDRGALIDEVFASVEG